MLDFIDRMTRDAVQLGPEDIARLREVGFDDTAILQMTLIGVLVQLHQPGGRCAGRGPGLISHGGHGVDLPQRHREHRGYF